MWENQNLPYDSIIAPSLEKAKEKNSVLILAGDISTINTKQRIQNLTDFLSWCSKQFLLVLYIPGNHEYYNSGMSIDDTNKKLDTICINAGAASGKSNVIFLNNQFYELTYKKQDGNSKTIAIIGTTLWSYIPPQYVKAITTFMADYHMILDFDTMTCNRLHRQSLKFIVDMLDHFKKQNAETVVITHHAPIRGPTSNKKYENSPLSIAFASHIPSLVEKADWWIFGHTHHTTKLKIKDCSLISNCWRYPDEDSIEYDPYAHFIVEYAQIRKNEHAFHCIS